MQQSRMASKSYSASLKAATPASVGISVPSGRLGLFSRFVDRSGQVSDFDPDPTLGQIVLDIIFSLFLGLFLGLNWRFWGLGQIGLKIRKNAGLSCKLS